MFIYAFSMPIIITKNLLNSLHLVNGKEFKAINIILDLRSPGYMVTYDVTLHFSPPLAILLKLDAIKNIAVDGLPRGHVLIGVDYKAKAKKKMLLKHYRFLQHPIIRTDLYLTLGFYIIDYKT